MSIESRAQKYDVVFNHWKVGELLGHGSGGKTAVFRLSRADSFKGADCALKVVCLIEERGNFASLSPYEREDYEQARKERTAAAEREVELMDSLKGNTNIVDYLDHIFVDWTDGNTFGRDMLVRMELLKDLRSEIQRGIADSQRFSSKKPETSFQTEAAAPMDYATEQASSPEGMSYETLSAMADTAETGHHFTEKEVLRIGRDICNALILCHRKNIIHRDIKPENIFINRDGNYKLGDFGVSKIVAENSIATTSIGTLQYLAPEQTSHSYDKRVDIYSLGLVLYELSNWYKLPFSESTYVRERAVVRRLHGDPLPAPSEASPALSKVILKACAHNPAERYQSAEELMEALSKIGKPTPPPDPPKKPRLKWVALVAGVALAATVWIALPQPKSEPEAVPISTVETSTAAAPNPETTLPAHTHRWEPSTCEAPMTCKDCGATIGDLKEHTYASAWSANESEHWRAASCTHTDLRKDVGTHNWDDGIDRVKPTASSAGERVFTCTVCRQTYSEVIPAVPEETKAHTHSYGQKVIAQEYLKSEASCTEAASYYYSCECGALGTKTFVSGKALGHSYDAGVVTKQPTENTKGITTYTCTRCTSTLKEDIPMLSHTHTFSAYWDCDSYQHWHSSTCGHQNETQDRALHSWNAGFLAVQPSHTSSGEKQYTCTVCQAVKKETVSPVPHEFTLQQIASRFLASEATCTEPARYFYSCSCGERSTETFSFGEAKGHSFSNTWSYDRDSHWHSASCPHQELKTDFGQHTWNSGVITRQATESHAGERTYTCTTCGAAKTEQLAALTHTHRFVNGVCSSCGYEDLFDFLNELTFTAKSGKLWTRSEASVRGADTISLAPNCWYDEYTQGHTQGTVRDMQGNTYTYGMHLDSGKTKECSITYELGGKYSRFTATLAYPMPEINPTYTPQARKYIIIYRDGKEYRTSIMYKGVSPIPINLDLTGVRTLRIVWPFDQSEFPNEAATLFDAKLYR